jgi:hypothetical protein
VQVFDFSLNKSDYDDIDVVCTKSNNLFNIIGDCGDELIHDYRTGISPSMLVTQYRTTTYGI